MPEHIVRRCIECECLIREADGWVVDGMLMRHTWCPATERTRMFRSLTDPKPGGIGEGSDAR